MIELRTTGDTANSYCSLAEAATYHVSIPHNADWFTAFVQEELAAALIVATRYIDLYPYKGARLNSSQALAWPRSNVYLDGVYVDGTPRRVVEATAQLALEYLRTDFTARSAGSSSASGTVQSLKAGSVQIDFGGEGATVDTSAAILSPLVSNMLRPLFGRGYTGGQGLVRV